MAITSSPPNGDERPCSKREPSIERGDTQNMSLIAALKSYPRIAGYILALFPAILLFGFDGVIVGSLTALPVFQIHYGEFGKKADGMGFIIPATWLGLWIAASPLGIMAGGISAGWTHDRYGRRFSLCVGAFITSVGVAICFGSNYPDTFDARRGVFFLGKLFEGMGTGATICTCQTLISEIVPVSLRSSSFALFPIFILLGQLIGAVVLFSQLRVSNARGYLTCIASQWVLSIAVIISALIVPESPTWLLRRGRFSDACAAEKRYQSPGVDSLAIVNQLNATLEQEKIHVRNSEASYRACFQGIDRRRTLLVILANVIPQFFGFQFLGNAAYFFQLLGMKPSLSVTLLQAGIAIGLLANFLSLWTLPRFRRRPLMIGTLFVSGVFYLVLSIAGHWTGPASLWICLVMFILIIFTLGLGIWPISVLVASEASSLQLRGKSQAIGWLFQGFATGAFAIVLPYIYSPDAGNAGALTGYVFFGFCWLTAIVVWAFIPDMKGRSAEQIDAMFIAKVPTRKWHCWKESEMVIVNDKVSVEHTENMA